MKPKVSKPFTTRLKVLMVSSEVFPFAKVGGLADVVAALSAQLKAFGHDVRIVLPKYSTCDLSTTDHSKRLSSMGVWMGDAEEWCSVIETRGNGDVPVYLIEHDLFFKREGLYHDNSMKDYDDNPRRFGFLCRSALQLCKDIGFTPDIAHVHDWQSALVPAYLKLWHWNDRHLGQCASVLTIHNIAYQGVYPKSHMNYLGIGWHNFTPDKFESHDQINYLKGGIYYADAVTTVSPSFARETTTAHGGFGLAPYLTNRSDSFRGITNGIDYSIWDPESDPYLPAPFSHKSPTGKKKCKRYLQQAFNLHQDDSIPLIGVIGRFVEQKGFELVAHAIERICQDMIVQFAILGTGEWHLESFFGDLPKRYGGMIGSYIGFDNPRAHLIAAGSDFFLMPSLFEPCGLTQMYSQRYGTLPIVRATGGLDDTVDQYDETTGDGTGFKFRDANTVALYYTVGWAVSSWYDRQHHIQKMIRTAMQKNFSWQRQTHEYETTYHEAMANKKRWDEGHRPYYH